MASKDTSTIHKIQEWLLDNDGHYRKVFKYTSSDLVHRTNKSETVETSITNIENYINTFKTVNIGSQTKPVYFVNGSPVEIDYSIEKSVPSDAKFTDTTYSNATSSTDGLMSKEDKAKLDGLNTSGGGISYNNATQSSDGLMSKEDKTKLDGLTNYSNATTSASGLMSSSDKSKLDDINLSNYNPKMSTVKTGGAPDNVITSLASSTTARSIGDFTLPTAGTYLIMATCRFAANTTGRRVLIVSDTSGSGKLSEMAVSVISPVSGADVYAKVTMLYVNSTANKKIYMNAYQNSGTTLDIVPRCAVVKLF